MSTQLGKDVYTVQMLQRKHEVREISMMSFEIQETGDGDVGEKRDRHSVLPARTFFTAQILRRKQESKIGGQKLGEKRDRYRLSTEIVKEIHKDILITENSCIRNKERHTY